MACPTRQATALQDAAHRDQILASFTYADSAWWPRGADGEGHSLVPRDPEGPADLNDPTSWRLSTNPFGSPGAADDPSQPAAPTITAHPGDVTVRPGDRATFTVVASGFPALSYQWQRNRAAVPGATNAICRITATAEDDGARFRCIVSNTEGTATSQEATLRVGVDIIPFRRGDANADGRTDISDAVEVLRFLFAGTAAPLCEDAADANDDGSVNVADAVSLLAYLFGGGPPPPAPFASCGFDPSDGEGLTCAAYPPCQ